MDFRKYTRTYRSAVQYWMVKVSIYLSIHMRKSPPYSVPRT